MSWSPSSASSWPSTCVVGARSGEVEHELVAGEDGFVAVGRQRPVRVGAIEVAVGVDHLRLDPDAELHAETGDVIDQGAEARGWASARRPNRRVPTCRRAVTRTSRRRGRSVRCRPRRHGRRARCKRVEVVVEVDRLPGVDEHRAWRASGWVGSRPQMAVESLRGRRQAGAGVDGDDLRRAVRLAGLEDELAGVEQLAELQVPPPVGQPLGEPARGCRSRPGGRPRPRRATRRIPRVPANTSGGCSCDVRPRRFSAVVRTVGPGERGRVQLARPAAGEAIRARRRVRGSGKRDRRARRAGSARRPTGWSSSAWTTNASASANVTTQLELGDVVAAPRPMSRS